MTLPTQTWRISATYPVTCAGANATMVEVFTAIKAAFAAEDVIGDNLWTISSSTAIFTTARIYIEIKRKGSPGGDLGGFRGFLFGGTSAAAANVIHPTVVQSATRMYCGTAMNRGTTDGPVADYLTAPPYDLTTHLWNKGCSWCTPGTFASTNAPKIIIVECDKMCSVLVVSDNHIAHILFGEIFERIYDNAALYGVIGCSDTYTGGGLLSQVGDGITSSIVPVVSSAANVTAVGGYRRPSDGQQRMVGRYGGSFTNTLTTSYVAESSTYAYALLFPFVLADRESIAAIRNTEVFGMLRQIRTGPVLLGKRAIFDGVPVLRGYSISPYTGTAGQTIIFDNSP